MSCPNLTPSQGFFLSSEFGFKKKDRTKETTHDNASDKTNRRHNHLFSHETFYEQIHTMPLDDLTISSHLNFLEMWIEIGGQSLFGDRRSVTNLMPKGSGNGPSHVLTMKCYIVCVSQTRKKV